MSGRLNARTRFRAMAEESIPLNNISFGETSASQPVDRELQLVRFFFVFWYYRRCLIFFTRLILLDPVADTMMTLSHSNWNGACSVNICLRGRRFLYAAAAELKEKNLLRPLFNGWHSQPLYIILMTNLDFWKSFRISTFMWLISNGGDAGECGLFRIKIE